MVLLLTSAAVAGILKNAYSAMLSLQPTALVKSIDSNPAIDSVRFIFRIVVMCIFTRLVL